MGYLSYGPPELDVWRSDGKPLGTITVYEEAKEPEYALRPRGGEPKPMCPVSDPKTAADTLAALVILSSYWGG
ncbi:hypothetical protein [Sphaerisporangium fuscum]|uniref:hypothetical protein n=1 Tax=Sphaerisporangium fuscum TaxID=2835868 RepID=UPI001BDC9ECB|nr:hypothetical protein [Sphaerisporangium fuscum]